MSRSITSMRVVLAMAAAALMLALAAPAMAGPQPPLPSGHHTQTSATVSPQSGGSDSGGFPWDGVVTIAVGALFGAGVTLGAMTLRRRPDQPVSAA